MLHVVELQPFELVDNGQIQARSFDNDADLDHILLMVWVLMNTGIDLLT